MSRVERLRAKMRETGIDALFITDVKNVSYVSGFTGDDSYVLILNAGNYFITDFRYIEQATAECSGFEIIRHDGVKRHLYELVKELLHSHGAKKLGFEKAHVTFASYEKLMANLTDVELVPVGEMIEELRYVKDQAEIERMRKAASIADRAFQEILHVIQPGRTEKELAAELEYYMKKFGADDIAFETILLSGVHTSLPHGKPGFKPVEEGDFITFDFGALYQGYRSDMTRTIVVGRVTPEQERIYNLVKEAQQKALDSIHAGVIGNIPDARAREVFAREGCEEYFGHGLGHGVGLLIHEEPFMGTTCTRVLEEQCVVTVEPGIYIPGWGGVRIEDTVVVTGDGCEILTLTPKDLLILK